MPLEQAREFMERLREVFSNYRSQEIPELEVSLSISLAAYQLPFEDAAIWLNEADKALYAAKITGRNKINVATSDPVREPSLARLAQAHWMPLEDFLN